MKHSLVRSLVLLCCVLVASRAEESSTPPEPSHSPSRAARLTPVASEKMLSYVSSVQAENQSNLKEHQIAFLNRIRKADPQHRTIERALFNNQNELGLIFNRSVELDKIPALMRSMLVQMAREFPGQDLTVLAYTPSNPPRKIGTARLNARTRDMTYTPEH